MKDLEKNLLEKVKRSDVTAFQKLFSNYHDSLFRFVVYRINDSDLAEDITQETFLRVWKKRETLVPEKSFFSLKIDKRIHPEPIPISKILSLDLNLLKLSTCSTINSVSGLGINTSWVTLNLCFQKFFVPIK